MRRKAIAKRGERDHFVGMSDSVPHWSIRPFLLVVALASFLAACQDRTPATPPSDPPAESSAAPETAASPVQAPAAPETAASEAAPVTSPETTPMKEGSDALAQGKETITLGGGCFWCTEAVVKRLEGVESVVSGYMGGHVENPTYEQVVTKTTGHAEVIQVSFDPAKITLDEILDVFWQAHDPTTLNRQGNDVGPQYRSVIFYHTPQQRSVAMQSMKRLDESKVYGSPAVTEIAEASKFWVAEDYHQNYYELNKDSNPYCRVVIAPKLRKLGME